MSETKKLETETEFEFAEIGEPVALAGATPRQITGHEAGRVVGFGCEE